MVCFNPNLQDLEGCEATPIDQLFNSGRRRRGAPNTNSRYVSRSMDESKGEELMDQFIRDVTGTEKQVKMKALKCKTLGGIQQLLALCIYCACAYECLVAPSPVSRLFHAGCTSS